MKVAKQTPTVLVVKAGAKPLLLIFGLIILVTGLLAVSLIKIRPLTSDVQRLPDLLESSRELLPAEAALQTSSPGGYGSLSVAHYVGELLFSEQRPVVVIGALGVLVGLLILLGPIYSRTVRLDKAGQQVILKQPRWFFRSKTEAHGFQYISEARVERDRETIGKTERNYRVDLVISHSEGTPLSRDFVHYKTVFPLTNSFRYDYKRAQAMVDRIQAFLEEAKVKPG